MTTTASAGQKAKPVKHDLTHGPVAAAFNASVWPMCITAIGKATGGVPPWAPLVAAVALAAGLAAAGAHRRPRPLSRVSLLYRSGVTAVIGVWMWAQLATFVHAGVGAGYLAAVAAAWLITAVAAVLAVASQRPPLVRLVMVAVPLLTAVVLTVVHLSAVTAWLVPAMTVTARFGQGFSGVLPWLGYTVLTLAIGGGPLGVLGMTFANRERSADEELARQQKANAPRTAAGEARVFLRMICKLTGEFTDWRPTDPYEPGRKIPNLSITDVRFWENGAGESYILDLTRNEKGTTRTKLRIYADDIATKMNLPHGCGVEILPARDANGEVMGAGYAAVDISRVNVLKELIEYPALEPRSILNPLPIGRTRSNKEIGPLLRENSAYVWGQKGSGKTGTIYDIILGALQCTDCLVWVIDLNRGNAARPFLRAWYEGKVDRPCVDWVATTIEEVAEMATVGLQIALDRKAFYADLKFELDTNLMPVGNGGPGQPPPEILIVIDEGAEVLGTGGNSVTDEGRAARDTLEKIMNLGRDAATNIVFSGLRATSDVAGTAFMRGTSVRVAMRVTDDAELGHGFGDYKLSGKQIPYKGSGYIRCGYDDGDGDTVGDDIMVFKAYFLAPKRMAAAGEEVTPWRPYLDELSLRSGGMTYANRWRRTAGQLWDNPPDAVRNYGRRTIDGEVVDNPAPVAARTTVKVDPLGDLKAAGLSRPDGLTFDDMMRAARDARAARTGKTPPDGGGEDGDSTPDPYQPPTGPATPDGPALPAAQADTGSSDLAAQFRDVVENMTVLDGDPERLWMRSGRITPDEELAAAPANTRDILERLVKIAGPVRRDALYAMLSAGGDWGPAVKISLQAMHNALKEKGPDGRRVPAAWLAPRAHGDPYNHRDNVSE